MYVTRDSVRDTLLSVVGIHRPAPGGSTFQVLQRNRQGEPCRRRWWPLQYRVMEWPLKRNDREMLYLARSVDCELVPPASDAAARHGCWDDGKPVAGGIPSMRTCPSR